MVLAYFPPRALLSPEKALQRGTAVKQELKERWHCDNIRIISSLDLKETIEPMLASVCPQHSCRGLCRKTSSSKTGRMGQRKLESKLSFTDHQNGNWTHRKRTWSSDLRP